MSIEQNWRPATEAEVASILTGELGSLHPDHRKIFEAMRVPMRGVPVDDSPGESVLVVAEHAEKLLYYSDVEDGWELHPKTSSGGIASRGSGQLELWQVMSEHFGEPDAAR